MLARENLLEAPHCVANRHVAAFLACECFSHEHGLREETLNLASAGNREPVLIGQFFDAQNRDNVLKVALPLQHLLDASGNIVVFLPNDTWLQNS